MILDEMITGFRWDLKGAQYFFGIEPDLSTFGKAMANGFSVAALTGKRDIMKLGGIEDQGQERVFLTSTTHGAEMSSLRAFIKTVEIMKRDAVINHFWEYGKKLMNEFNLLAREFEINEYIRMDGYSCSPNISIKDFVGEEKLSCRTLFLQEMINNNVIMPYVALSFSHREKELEMTLDALNNTFNIMKKAQYQGVNKFLKSKKIKPVFRTYN